MKRVLVVDDDIQLRPLLEQILVREGYEVRTASNGVEALAALQAEFFDLMITDIIMPEKEGLETISEIRRQDLDIKIIAISGGGRADAGTYLRLAKAQGADRILIKPFERNEIIEAIEELLGEPASSQE
ncbi:response regulator [Planctomycetota bacterium]